MSKPDFINYYRCPEDGEEWADIWSCCCNDRCPKCGIKDIEPYKSQKVVHTKTKEELLKPWPRVEGVGSLEHGALKGRRYRGKDFAGLCGR